MVKDIPHWHRKISVVIILILHQIDFVAKYTTMSKGKFIVIKESINCVHNNLKQLCI